NGVDKKIDEVISLYHAAALNGSAEAVAAELRCRAEKGEAEAQYNYGCAYFNNKGASNPIEAVKWWRKAAEQGYAAAQYNLGCMYMSGLGILKDEIEGLAWFNLSAVSGYEHAIKNRDVHERRLGTQVALMAQQRSKELVNQTQSGAGGSKSGFSQSDNETPLASGTGTIVSATGHVLTAAHVVAGANRLQIVTTQGSKTASVLHIDESNDLAVLKLEAGTYTAIPVAPSNQVRLGQSVATVGFPHVQLQGFSPKVTRGEISSLKGAADDPRNWQISVPVQSGNSGGPLLDENGNLIGVIISKLGIKAAAMTGDLPQNVSYAVKSAYALPLLEFRQGCASG
ncbi:MAG: trypsin-like peptidase domain-containing protein, partial [Verrucomicrobia bacterium]|nr:trypsin-like peptidase domain-containing protein [Verrucomicrobiota bacterium]